MLAKDEIRNWTIYKITSPSGRVYIGKTSNFRLRMNNYRNNCEKQTVLNNSFKKYGIDAHVFEIVEIIAGNLGEANSKEMFWIRTYMSNKNKYPKQRGMNLTDGGEGQIGMKHSQESKDKMRYISLKNGSKPPKVIWTDEMKKKMSEDKKGKPIIGRRRGWTDAQRKEQSESRKGQKAWNKGIKYDLTPEERKIKFGHNKGKKINQKKPSPQAYAAILAVKCLPVLQYTLDGIFIKEYASGSDASIATGMSQDTIRFIAKGLVKKPTKCIFKYKNKEPFTKITFQRRIFKQADLKQRIA